MRLDVEALSKAGGFSGAPVKREIEWGEYVFDVYVRRLSYHSAVSDFKAVAANGDIAAARIASCIVNEEGDPIFKVSDITGVEEDGSPVMTTDEDGNKVERGALAADLATELLVAISEVNGLGKLKKES